jgi:transporter family-2 protein
MNWQNLAFGLLAIVAGSLFPVQAAINALLAKGIGGSIVATLVSFTIGWLALLLMNVAIFRQFPTVAEIARQPVLVLVVGGVIGAIYVSVNVLLAPKLGSAAVLCLVIAGQLVGALAIDRFGLFEFEPRELSTGRIIGVVMVFVGALLVRLA